MPKVSETRSWSTKGASCIRRSVKKSSPTESRHSGDRRQRSEKKLRKPKGSQSDKKTEPILKGNFLLSSPEPVVGSASTGNHDAVQGNSIASDKSVQKKQKFWKGPLFPSVCSYFKLCLYSSM